MSYTETRQGPPDDRTAKARLRDAAVELIAEEGAATLTARRVADRAGLSAGLVTHHYGSMQQLRAAADHHVAGIIRHLKSTPMGAAATFNVLASAYTTGYGPLVAYLGQRLSDPSPEVAALVDEMIDDAVGYLGSAEEAGQVKATDNPRDRAALLVLSQLGTLVLNDHMKRIFDVDLVSPDLFGNSGFTRYFEAALELYAEGVITDDYATELRAAMRAQPGEAPR